MGQFLKKSFLVSLAAMLVFSLSLPAYAANRSGSHRVGGTNSHGKGSHYSGGNFIEQTSKNVHSLKSLCINNEVKKSPDCLS